MSKMTKSAQIRALAAEVPTPSAKEIAYVVGVSPQYVSQILWLDRKKALDGAAAAVAEQAKLHAAERAEEIEARAQRALDVQVGGDHYKKLKIQPVEYIHANGIGYFEGNVVKYVTRWRDKNGIADLEKAKHYIDLLIEQEKSHGCDA